MDKTKMFLSKINKKMWLYLLDLMIAVFAINLLLNVFNLAFRNWVYIVITTIAILGILIKIIQKFLKLPTNEKGVIGICICILVFIGTVFSRITLMFLFLILLGISSIIPSAEHIVERNGKKYVAQVYSGFLNTDVNYYDYVNFLIRGNKKVETEYYKGAYDPIERQENENKEKEIKKKDENNTITNSSQNTTKQEIIKKEEIIEDKDIIFTQKIDNTLSIRVIDRGNVLGQRKIIQIQKTTDNGKTWKNTLKTLDGAMTVNNDAKVSFINDKVRIY